LPVKVLSRLFRRLMLETLLAAHDTGRLLFFGDHAHLTNKAAFKAYLAPLRRTKWFVYSKRPFAGPEQVLAYLSRYTHRVAISNSRLIAADANGVTFRYKDYRIKGPGRCKTMTLKPGEFIRRFLMHVLPKGFHRIRHCGLLASGTKTETIAWARELIATATPAQTPQKKQPPESAAATNKPTHPCPCWTHEYNRDLQARLSTSISAATNRDQDRYVMITFPVSQIQNSDPACWSSIRHGGARANARWRLQHAHRSSLLKTDICPCRGLLPGNVVGQHTHGRHLPSRSSPAVLKSP
jgi:hypothetical protein